MIDDKQQIKALKDHLLAVADGTGVRKPDLYDKLGAELRVLWSLGVAESKESTRRKVERQLLALIPDVVIGSRSDRALVNKALCVYFNIGTPDAMHGLNVQPRQAEFDREFRISEATQQRYSGLAVVQMAEMIQRQIGQRSVEPLTNPETTATPGLETEPAQDSPEQGRPTAHRSPLGKALIGSTGKGRAGRLAAVLLAAGLVAWKTLFSADQAHITYTVTHLADSDHCDNWMFPGKTPQQIPIPADGPSADWAHARGGVDNDFTRIKVDVQGSSATEIPLDSLQVVHIRKTKSLVGTKVVLNPGCGGTLPEANYQVTLNDAMPQFKIKTVHGDGSVTFGNVPFSFGVSNTNPQVFAIEADANIYDGKPHSCNCLISWELQLNWSNDGKKKPIIINDNGKPFETNDYGGTAFVPMVIDDHGKWSQQNTG